MSAVEVGDLVTLQGWSVGSNSVIEKMLEEHGHLWVVTVATERAGYRIKAVATGYTRWIGYRALIKPEEGANT